MLSVPTFVSVSCFLHSLLVIHFFGCWLLIARYLSSCLTSTAADFSILHFLIGISGAHDLCPCPRRTYCLVRDYLRPSAHRHGVDNRTPETNSRLWELAVWTWANFNVLRDGEITAASRTLTRRCPSCDEQVSLSSMFADD